MLPRMYPVQQGEGGDGGQGGGAGGAGDYTPMAGEAFIKALPPDLRGHTALAPIKDMGALVKGFVHAQSMVGADKIVLPKADADDKAWNEVWDKLGRPTDPMKYEGIGRTADMPQDFPLDDEQIKTVKQIFHEAGLTPKQAQKVFAKYTARQVEDYKKAQDKYNQQKTQFVDSLKQKYGDAYEVRIAQSRQAVETMGGRELSQFMETSGLGDHPLFVNLFMNFAELLANDQVVRDRFANQGRTGSKDEALSEIAKLNGDENFMKGYLNAEDPNHAAAVERMSRLYKTAYPGTQAPG